MSGSSLKLLALGTVAALATGCDIQAQSIGVDGSFDRTLAVNGPVDLDVLSRSGHIQVHVGPATAVHIVGHIRAHGSLFWMNGYTAAEQARKLETSPPIEQTGNDINVGYIWDEALAGNVSISYDVTVPSETRLRASSRSGDQTIEAIRGPVTASSRSGQIRIERVAGDLDIDTRSGDIELLQQRSDVRVTSRSGHVRLEGQPSNSWVIETRSGEVDARLPAGGGADLDLQTRSGSIDSDRPIQISASRSRKHLQGTVGRGGGRLEVSTSSGSIRIR
jgi:hypothetical protein